MLLSQSEMLVKDLFVHGQREWDSVKIRSVFLERDSNLIISIPFSVRHIDDFWSWMHDKHGAYTVQSAYKGLHMQEEIIIGQDITFWQKI